MHCREYIVTNKVAISNFQTIENIEHTSLKVKFRSFVYIYVQLCDFLIPGLQSVNNKIIIFTNIMPDLKIGRYNKS